MYFTNRLQNYNIFLDYARDIDIFLHFFIFFIKNYAFYRKTTTKTSSFSSKKMTKSIYIHSIYIVYLQKCHF